MRTRRVGGSDSVEEGDESMLEEEKSRSSPEIPESLALSPALAFATGRGKSTGGIVKLRTV